MNAKQRAAKAAISFVESGMVVGLGTGSTADFFLVALAGAVRDGRLREIRGIPTSRQSQMRAEELGIPLIELDAANRPDITIDGADEVDGNLNLIKGLGGALLREKIVAQNSGKLVIIADESKVVKMLGTKSALPVEVAVFAYAAQEEFLRSLGCAAVLRKNPAGCPFLTDNGNYILDCRFTGIADPAELQGKLKARAGIVETGLFLDMAEVAIIGSESGVREMRRSSGSR
ncbi:MAG TPA: ribose-5-phosphate isomerase RpiA [Tepidisphaeraceae bacterium]